MAEAESIEQSHGQKSTCQGFALELEAMSQSPESSPLKRHSGEHEQTNLSKKHNSNENVESKVPTVCRKRQSHQNEEKNAAGCNKSDTDEINQADTSSKNVHQLYVINLKHRKTSSYAKSTQNKRTLKGCEKKSQVTNQTETASEKALGFQGKTAAQSETVDHKDACIFHCDSEVCSNPGIAKETKTSQPQIASGINVSSGKNGFFLFFGFF